MDKIKTLVIAPYNGLKDLINETAKERQELEVHTFVADMLDGVEVVKSIQDKGYDAIISRAGTADLIREVSDLPVIDIKLSIIDMMRAIKLAQNYVGQFVIVGFKSITEVANIICQLHEYDIEIKTISHISEIRGCLTEIKERGINLIIGDVVTNSYAKMMGFNTVLVTSGKESVQSSFDEVIKLKKLLLTTEKKNLLIKNILENSDNSVICFNSEKKMIYSNIKEDIEGYKKILDEIDELIEVLMKEKECKLLKKLGNHYILIKGKTLEFNGSIYPTFYFEHQKTAFKVIENAVSYKNRTDLPQVSFKTIFTSSESYKKVLEDAQALAVTSAPVLIIGDKGTGKGTLAQAIYRESQYNNNPLIIIDAEQMNEKKWTSMLESENSLFTNSDFTIFVNNIHLMDAVSQRLVESYFLNTYVHKRNRFIFSCVMGYAPSFDNGSLLSFLKNTLVALPITIPNLSERSEDIPSLASLYLSDFILKYGKQVIGLDAEALKLLQEYQWTDNIHQLKRIIEQSIILSDSLYIQADTVKRVLSYEMVQKSNMYMPALDLNKTLDDINKDLINYILQEENNNQSRAAERLGISRSTLWRKIK